MASQLGPRGGSLGGYTQKWSVYTHTHDRLDKSRSALAEARLKSDKTIPYICNHTSIPAGLSSFEAFASLDDWTSGAT